MTINDNTECPTDDEIAERAAELDTVRHRLMRDATPQEPGFGPCVELAQFEEYASDADWLMRALLARDAELERTNRADLAAQFRVESDKSKARRDDPATTSSTNRRSLVAHHDTWAYAMRAAAHLVDPPVSEDALVEFDIVGQAPQHTASDRAEHLEGRLRSRSR